MRKIFIPIAALIVACLLPMACRMAPSQNMGDTVAASVFYPRDTVRVDTARVDTDTVAATDSIDSIATAKPKRPLRPARKRPPIVHQHDS